MKKSHPHPPFAKEGIIYGQAISREKFGSEKPLPNSVQAAFKPSPDPNDLNFGTKH
jgi:hypothetical protein